MKSHPTYGILLHYIKLMHNDNNDPAIISILILATILLFIDFCHSKNILKMVVDMLVYSSQLRSK